MVEGWLFIEDNGQALTEGGEQLCVYSTPWQALQHAHGPILCWVKNGTIVSRADMTEELERFARRQALEALRLCDTPPNAVLEYLQSGDKAVRTAARDAAWVSVQTTARGTARIAARIAALYATRVAVDGNAPGDARTAAMAAAQAKARVAVWSAPQPAAWVAAEADALAAAADAFDAFVNVWAREEANDIA